MADRPPQIGTTSAERAALYRTLTNPVRRKILDHLARAGEQNSTTLAAELGESTGTTSYHLRKLADQEVIEEIPERGNARQRWWRLRPFHLERPAPGDMSEDEAAAAEQWHRLRTDRDIALLLRAEAAYTGVEGWVQGLRSNFYLTRDELHALVGDLHDLLGRYRRTPDDAPPDAQEIAVRFFALPNPIDDVPEQVTPSASV